eukprot:gene10150-2313_t
MASSSSSTFHSAKEKAKQWLKGRLQRSTHAFTTEPGAFDTKTIPRLSKLIKKIMNLSTEQKINLKTSPPYLQGILYDTSSHLTLICSANSMSVLKECPYLNLFTRKFIQIAKCIIKLFGEAKAEMEIESSEYRRRLSKYSLVLSHMLADLIAVYKQGKLNEVSVIKIEARSFWKDNFQDRIVVPWTEFLPALATVHPLLSENEAPLLKETIDITENHHVSWFEFDVFTRLFQPWAQLIDNWYVLAVNHPAFKAFITYDEVEVILRQCLDKPGSYVFRLSCTRLGQWAIGFVTREKSIVQTIPSNIPLHQALIEGVEEGIYLYPNGQNEIVDVKRMLADAPAARVELQVSKEQYDIYCEIDSSFELCKICNANVKSVRLEPCSHLMCKDCLRKWTATSTSRQTTCPFCRKPVLCMENIVVAPFLPETGSTTQSILFPGKQGEYDNINDCELEDSDEDINEEDLNNLADLYFPEASRNAPLPPIPPQPKLAARRPSISNHELSSLPSGRRDRLFTNPSASQQTQGRSSHDQRRTSIGQNNTVVNPLKLKRLIDMGFSQQQAEKALQASRDDIDIAINILLSFAT